MSEVMEQLNIIHEMKQTLSSADGHTDSRSTAAREEAASKTNSDSTLALTVVCMQLEQSSHLIKNRYHKKILNSKLVLRNLPPGYLALCFQ